MKARTSSIMLSAREHVKAGFLTSRIYGGYANQAMGGGKLVGCSNPEPYAYEGGIAVQRMIVNQINGTNDNYSGAVDTTHAPWFDWGPYIWASGPNVSPSTGLLWCNNNPNVPQCVGKRDLNYGDLNNSTYWGDFTHPTASAEQKVASQLVQWIQGQLPLQDPQSATSVWLGWINQ